jgi:hypothetical protein
MSNQDFIEALNNSTSVDNIDTLEIGVPYRITRLYPVDTRFGRTMVAELAGEDGDEGREVYLPKRHAKKFLDNCDQTYAINTNVLVLKLTFHGRDAKRQNMAKVTFHN